MEIVLEPAHEGEYAGSLCSIPCLLPAGAPISQELRAGTPMDARLQSCDSRGFSHSTQDLTASSGLALTCAGAGAVSRAQLGSGHAVHVHNRLWRATPKQALERALRCG